MSANPPEWYAKFDKHFHALGRMIHAFAAVERSLVVAIREVAGLNQNLSSALLSSIRVDSGISMLRRVHRANGTPLTDEVENTLTQLREINSARNLVIHHGVDLQSIDEPLYASNFRVAMPDVEPVVIELPPESLTHMFNDLCYALCVIEGTYCNKNPNANDFYVEAFSTARERSWHYKPG